LQVFGQFIRQRLTEGKNRAAAQAAAARSATPAAPMPSNDIAPVAQNMDAPAPQMSKRRSLLTAQAATGGRYGRLAKDLLG
jgi:hypothetical protein